MIKVIVFDLWSTLGYKKYKTGDTAHLSNEIKVPYRKALKTYEKHFQLDKKSDFVAKYSSMLKDLGKYDLKIAKKYAVLRKRQELNCVFYAYAIPLLKLLRKKGYKVALLSNTTYVSGSKILKSSLRKHIDKFFFSYDIGCIKPDPKCFKKILSYFKVKPKETLMIGNTYEDDYLAAKKVGLNAIHFKNGRQVQRELKKMGVI